MDITIKRSALAPALDTVTRLVEARNSIPILSNILLDASIAGSVTIIATNLEITAAVTLPATTTAPGRITAPARDLHAFVRATTGDLRLTVDSAAVVVTLRAGRSRLSLPILPADDYPQGQRATGQRWTVQGAALATRLAPLLHAVSTEEARYYLNGISLEQDASAGTICMIATDGHRLAHTAIAYPGEGDPLPRVIVPSRTAAEILRAATAAGDGEITLTIGEQRIALHHDALILTSSLIDGTFPDWRRVVPIRDEETFAVIDRDEMQAAIARIVIAGSADDSKNKPTIRLDLAQDQITLTCTSRVDPSRAGTETIAAKWDGPETTIGINSIYLTAALKAGTGPERISIADNIALLQDAGGVERVVMGMRI